MTQTPIAAAMIGAGQRGFFIYGEAALRSGVIRFDAVVDPSETHRRRFATAHGIPESKCFAGLSELVDADLELEAWFVCSPDRAHADAVRAGIGEGVALFVEKPVVTDIGALVSLSGLAARSGTIIQVAHVLRYSPLFRRLHDLVAADAIGEVVSVVHSENVHALHMAHSYVRGNWAVEAASSPMLLAKACHDLDILHWNLSSPVRRISSFGSLQHFRADNAPPEATPRCTDGCPVSDCLYDARQQYLGDWTGWPVHVISDDTSLAARRRALETGPYGRCVYHAGNDVVDHQMVTMELESGATVLLRVHGHAFEDSRTMRYDGTDGTIRAVASEREQRITLVRHRGADVQEFVVGQNPDDDKYRMGHGGGDEGALVEFVDAIRGNRPPLTAFEESVASHAVAFAAERARRSSAVVELPRFLEEARTLVTPERSALD